MKACSIKFPLSIGDKVTIKATQLAGTVIALFVDRDGQKSVQVEYHDRAGVLQAQWFRRDALN